MTKPDEYTSTFDQLNRTRADKPKITASGKQRAGIGDKAQLKDARAALAAVVKQREAALAAAIAADADARLYDGIWRDVKARPAARIVAGERRAARIAQKPELLAAWKSLAEAEIELLS